MKAYIIDAMAIVRTRPYTHDAALAAEDIIVVNGSAMVAINDTAANVQNVFAYRGKLKLAKKAGVAFPVNSPVYLDVANSEATDVALGNIQLGTCDEFAAAGDTTIIVMLDENR